MAQETWRKAFRKLAPSWLTTGEGEQVLWSLMLICDAFCERMRLGVLSRFPAHAPEDALAYIARDRKLIRGIGESQADFAVRLAAYLDEHRVRGNPFALLRQIRAYCQADIVVRTVDRAGNWYTIAADGTESTSLAAANWDWDGAAASLWARFWVIIYPTAAGEPWAITTPDWGDAGLWSDAFGTPGLTFGTTATPNDVANIRAIIADWKPAGTRCEWIIIAFDAASFPPGGTPGVDLPNGDYGNWGIDSAGVRVAARLSTARYWKGPTA